MRPSRQPVAGPERPTEHVLLLAVDDTRVVEPELFVQHDLAAGLDLQHGRERGGGDGLVALPVPRIGVADGVGELHDAIALDGELDLAVGLADEPLVERHRSDL